ncbi:MAG: hypothetical protein B193_0359 [Solidesulfovibrio magneticus str. Maddingley MBC34]|uniref:Uncharacterized protein n=1 Tax=Solidesulfovibrio magneticus str. Maddingley MBC34 TaxID=1206767 RepID=K6GVM2_9BACT|nr:MAG: hypothetical protein B193_0359 [Solidesulfovibrio magneticus str. Maddingley MBC34]
MLRHVIHGPGQGPRNRPWPTVLAALLATLCLTAMLGAPALAAPPGPADLSRSIETARVAITGLEKTIVSYDAEMRSLTGNDPASARRREEIRIIKQHYVREIETLKAKIIDDYKKIQDFKARGIQ